MANPIALFLTLTMIGYTFANHNGWDEFLYEASDETERCLTKANTTFTRHALKCHGGGKRKEFVDEMIRCCEEKSGTTECHFITKEEGNHDRAKRDMGVGLETSIEHKMNARLSRACMFQGLVNSAKVSHCHSTSTDEFYGWFGTCFHEDEKIVELFEEFRDCMEEGGFKIDYKKDDAEKKHDNNEAGSPENDKDEDDEDDGDENEDEDELPDSDDEEEDMNAEMGDPFGNDDEDD